MPRASLVLLLLMAACGGREAIRAERVAHQVVASRETLEVERRGMMVRESEPPLRPVQECQPGDRRRDPLTGRRWIHCIEHPDGSHRWPVINTPLVVAFDDQPVVFTRSDAVFHVGLDDRTEWVSAATPWLALDRDGSGCIESERELFAGFDALAPLDDDRNGRIDARDAAFAELQLWADTNQDKRCTPDELRPLGFPIDLAHTEPTFAAGSFEGETAALPTRAGRVVDVYLAPAR